MVAIRKLSKSEAASLRARIETETLRAVSHSNLSAVRGGPEKPPTPYKDRLPRADEPLTDEESAALSF